MKRKGIFVNGKHSYYAYGLRMTKRTIGSAPKDEHLERVPFSNITYNFDSLFAKKSYGERKLSYELEFIESNIEKAEDKLISILNWLHWDNSINLVDDFLPDYHFSVREPEVSHSEKHGVYSFKISFMAAPAIVANPNKWVYNAANTLIPDINGDGIIDAIDEAMIRDAYAAVSANPPRDPGLTPEQLKRCDANLNGEVDSVDASWVSRFYAQLSTGKYNGLSLEAAWAAYLNERKQTGGGEVY